MRFPAHDEEGPQALQPCPLNAKHPPAVTRSIALLGSICFLSACQSVPTKTCDVRRRAFTYNTAALVQDYREEYAYIEVRGHHVDNGNSNPSSTPRAPVT